VNGVIILGAGGTGRDLVDWHPDLAAAGRPLRILGFLDDDPAKMGREIGGAKVLGTLADLARFPNEKVIDALGSPASYLRRESLMRGIEEARFVTLVHPLARVSPRATLGVGALIYPFTFIGPDVTIGRHVIALSHVAVNHDSQIGDFSILAAHVAVGGGVTVGRSVYLGMRSALREGVRVGDGAMVGMGAAVTKDVAAGTTVIGVPARPKG
jgi:sugar O-acyltransferase (sialic acid O-acetyltransferase NeuD family)